MFLDLFDELRARKVPVATQDWLLLMRGLELGLHGSSLDGFYHLARLVCVKDVGHYDAFDVAWLKVMRGVETVALALTDELARWLDEARQRGDLTQAEKDLVAALSPDELRELYRKRLEEQKRRHDGGSKWIGTGGTSPFGSGGRHPTGLRVGGGGQRSAMQVAGERRWGGYRRDLVLDVRQIDLALRLLRELGREGAPEELDLDATIDRTSRNAGDLEIVMAAPRRNRTKVLLLMDVGGSMDPHAHLVERLFTAASRAGRFARFRSYYFHNCVYDELYASTTTWRSQPVADVLGESSHDERLIIVGDAAMHPAELLQEGGSAWGRNPTPGIEWMRRVAEHFRHRAWLNPEPEAYWGNTTVRILRGLYPMYPLTLDGLHDAVRRLVRAGAAAEAA